MWYLCHFLHRHLDFRISEIESIATLLGYGQLQWQPPPGGNPLSPFWRVSLPDDEAVRRVVERSLLLKASARSAASSRNFFTSSVLSNAANRMHTANLTAGCCQPRSLPALSLQGNACCTVRAPQGMHGLWAGGVA